MNLREALQKILSEWTSATQKQFKGNQLANFIRDDLVEIVNKVCKSANHSPLLKASAGAGNWANVPWLSILSTEITSTTQDGIYPVYLFRADGTGVYLSLNQGTTKPTEELGKKDSENRAIAISNFLHSHIPPLQSWDNNTLKLRANTALGKSYEKPNIGARFYQVNELPPNEKLEDDLKELLYIYQKVVNFWPQLSDYRRFSEDTSPETLSTKSSNTIIIPKPFLLLAGISGTGKTRFVRAQAARSNGWSADDPRKPDNYELVAVRPDWHEPSDILGYVSRIGKKNYVPTDFLSFLVKAWHDVFDKSGSLTTVADGTRPFWLCLDEMNLAPVEQYFADYLSILESRKWSEEDGYSSLPIISDDLELVMEALGGSKDEKIWQAFFKNGGIPLPPNLIVAGTVNMDETTHGFSRKVIDRALTLDFQEFFPNNYNEFFAPETEPVLFDFSTASQVGAPEELESVTADPDGSQSIKFLSLINDKLKTTPFELAFRALNELLLSVKCFAPEDEKELVAVWDDFLMQKVLPRIEGDAERLQYTGEEDSGLLTELKQLIQQYFMAQLNGADSGTPLTRPDLLNRKTGGGIAPGCLCKSLKKIDWMQKRLEQNQYTSFWA